MIEMNLDSIEVTILRNLLFNEEFLRKVVPFIKSEYFENINQKIIFEEVVNFVSRVVSEGSDSVSSQRF